MAGVFSTLLANSVKAVRKAQGDEIVIPKPDTSSFESYLSFFNYKLWDGQKKMFNTCERVLNDGTGEHSPLVVVSSGHNVGKSWGSAEYIAYLLLKHESITCLIISPSGRITKTQSYGHVQENCRRFEPYADVNITDKVLKVGKSRCIPVNLQKGKNANNVLQGYHDEFMFILCDEAANLKKDALQSLLSCASGRNSLILMLGNPIADNSKDSNNALNYAASISPSWSVMSLSSAEHPNVLNNSEEIKGAIDRRFVTSIIHEHCIPYIKDESDSLDLPILGSVKTRGEFKGMLTRMTYSTTKFSKGQLIIANSEACRRVFGLIMPFTPKNGILPLSFFDNLHETTEEFIEVYNRVKPEIIYMGLDPARLGADSGKLAAMFYEDNDIHLCMLDTLKKKYTSDYCQVLYGRFKDFMASHIIISVDSTGGYGAGTIDLTNSLSSDDYTLKSDKYANITWFHENHNDVSFELIPFNFAESCKTKKDKLRYKNEASMIAEVIRTSAGIYKYHTYNFSQDDKDGCIGRLAWNNGRHFMLQPKSAHKAENGGKSPDGFDAFLMCVLSKVRGRITVSKDSLEKEENEKALAQREKEKRNRMPRRTSANRSKSKVRRLRRR